MAGVIQTTIEQEAAKEESPLWQLSSTQRELLGEHLRLVIERNRHVNLTRITNEREAVYLHIVDSLLLRDALDAAPKGRFADIGTGAGYPGVPLAVATGRRATCIDSVGKKTAAVADFCNELGLDDLIRVCHARAEDVAKTERGTYAAVCARAVAKTNVLVEYAAPLLKIGGRAIIAKARPSDEEIRQGNAAAKLCGLCGVSRETYELPHGLGHREVLVYEKTAQPRLRLPRPVGMAASHPLGV